MKGLGNFIDFFDKRNFLHSRIKPKVGRIYLVYFHYPHKFKSLSFQAQTFVGICISVRRPKKLTSIFSLRNVLNKDPIEFSFFFNSPLIRALKFVSNSRLHLYNRNKLYYLRNKRLGQSRV